MRGQIERRVWADGKTATWTGRFAYEDPLTGQRRHKRVSAPTRKLAEEKLRAAIAKLDGGDAPLDDRATLREWSAVWLAEAAGRVRPATHRRYGDALRLHVLPALGHVRLAKLGAAHLNALYADRLAAGLSPSSVHQIHGVLSACCKAAVRAGVLGRDPTATVRAPAERRHEARVWNREQTAAVLAAADATPLAVLWRLALLCGLRRGELLGLRWEDVDLDRGVLAVRRSYSRTGKGGFGFAEPKTTGSRRAIALPASCVAALRGHRTAQDAERDRLGVLWRDDGLVFTGSLGQPLHPNTFTRRFDELVAAAGVPRIRPHDTRHSSATLLMEAGIHPLVVSQRLGHSSVQMTLDRYSHVGASLQEAAAAALDAALPANGTVRTGGAFPPPAPTARPRPLANPKKRRKQADS